MVTRILPTTKSKICRIICQRRQKLASQNALKTTAQEWLYINGIKKSEYSCLSKKNFVKMETKYGSYIQLSYPSNNILLRLLGFSKKNDVYIHLLESNHKGDGTKLMIEAAKIAKERNCGLKLLAGRLGITHSGIHPAGFYLKLGFEPTGWRSGLLKRKWKLALKNNEILDWKGGMKMRMTPDKVVEFLKNMGVNSK